MLSSACRTPKARPGLAAILCFYTAFRWVAMEWFQSDDIPNIPADILARLESTLDTGDCFDVAEAERERSSVSRVVAINQQLYWRMAQLRTELEAANTNLGYNRDQIQGLVKTLSRLGHVPSHKPPVR